jgi:hypothetical protein
MAAYDSGLPALHVHENDSRRIGRAWLALCFTLGVHVVDEAANGFLTIYNPTVLAIRENIRWLPLPVFDYETWIVGLTAAVVVLCILAVFVFRGTGWTRPAAYVFALVMAGNAVMHTVGTMLGYIVPSVPILRPMPGFYSAPLLMAASVYMLLQLRSVGPGSRR